MNNRTAEVKRKTKETDIQIYLNLDGKGIAEINTPIPFFNHMLESFTRHSLIDLKVIAKGDVEVDYHHTIEDVGIVLGVAIKEALGEKIGIKRFADATVPMDDALTRVALDLSGRSFLIFNVSFSQPDDGCNINPYLFEEFFRGFTSSSAITMHIDLIRGNNTHHIIESIFKSFATAFKNAISIVRSDLPSTKGKL